MDLQVQRNQDFAFDERTVVATSPHSFKGYDSEIVVIPSVETILCRWKDPFATRFTWR